MSRSSLRASRQRDEAVNYAKAVEAAAMDWLDESAVGMSPAASHLTSAPPDRSPALSMSQLSRTHASPEQRPVTRPTFSSMSKSVRFSGSRTPHSKTPKTPQSALAPTTPRFEDSLVKEPLRRSKAEWDSISAELEEAKRELRKVREENARLRVLHEQSQQSFDEGERQRERLSNLVSRQAELLEQRDAELSELGDKASKASRSIDEVQGERDLARREVAALREEIHELRGSIQVSSDRASKSDSRLGELRAQVSELERLLSQARAESAREQARADAAALQRSEAEERLAVAEKTNRAAVAESRVSASRWQSCVEALCAALDKLRVRSLDELTKAGVDTPSLEQDAVNLSRSMLEPLISSWDSSLVGGVPDLGASSVRASLLGSSSVGAFPHVFRDVAHAIAVLPNAVTSLAAQLNEVVRERDLVTDELASARRRAEEASARAAAAEAESASSLARLAEASKSADTRRRFELEEAHKRHAEALTEAQSMERLKRAAEEECRAVREHLSRSHTRCADLEGKVRDVERQLQSTARELELALNERREAVRQAETTASDHARHSLKMDSLEAEVARLKDLYSAEQRRSHSLEALVHQARDVARSERQGRVKAEELLAHARDSYRESSDRSIQDLQVLLEEARSAKAASESEASTLRRRLDDSQHNLSVARKALEASEKNKAHVDAEFSSLKRQLSDAWAHTKGKERAISLLEKELLEAQLATTVHGRRFYEASTSRISTYLGAPHRQSPPAETARPEVSPPSPAPPSPEPQRSSPTDPKAKSPSPQASPNRSLVTESAGGGLMSLLDLATRDEAEWLHDDEDADLRVHASPARQTESASARRQDDQDVKRILEESRRRRTVRP
jgi:hypothetical protein